MSGAGGGGLPSSEAGRYQFLVAHVKEVEKKTLLWEVPRRARCNFGSLLGVMSNKTYPRQPMTAYDSL